MQKTKEMFTQAQSFKDNIQTQEQPARGIRQSPDRQGRSRRKI